MNGERSRYKNLADLSGGVAFKSGDYAPEGRFILRTLNIRDDCSISRDDAVYLPKELCPQYARFELQSDDTLFVMVGATLGKIGFVRAKDLPALLNQNMWLIRAKHRVADPRFVHYAFAMLRKQTLDGHREARGILFAAMTTEIYGCLRRPSASNERSPAFLGR